MEIDVLTLSKTTILDWSKLKEIADDNFQLDENGRKVSKWAENTSNFSFSHSVFKRLELETCKNQGLFRKGLTGYKQEGHDGPVSLHWLILWYLFKT